MAAGATAPQALTEDAFFRPLFPEDRDQGDPYILAVPPEGMTFKVRVPAAATASLASAAVTIGTWSLPGSEGRRLLPWLPNERTDWTTYAQWVVRPESAAEVPVEAVPGAPLPTPGPPPPAPAQPAPAQAAPAQAAPAPAAPPAR